MSICCLGPLRAGLAFMVMATSLAVFPICAQQTVAVWLSSADGGMKLAPQPALPWHKAPTGQAGITIDDTKTYQTMLGFGHALTGGSAQLLMKMSPPARKALLTELLRQWTRGYPYQLPARYHRRVRT